MVYFDVLRSLLKGRGWGEGEMPVRWITRRVIDFNQLVSAFPLRLIELTNWREHTARVQLIVSICWHKLFNDFWDGDEIINVIWPVVILIDDILGSYSIIVPSDWKSWWFNYKCRRYLLDDWNRNPIARLLADELFLSNICSTPLTVRNFLLQVALTNTHSGNKSTIYCIGKSSAYRGLGCVPNETIYITTV